MKLDCFNYKFMIINIETTFTNHRQMIQFLGEQAVLAQIWTGMTSPLHSNMVNELCIYIVSFKSIRTAQSALEHFSH